MCGRFTETADVKRLAEELGIPVSKFPKIVPRYNIAPSLPVLTLRKDPDRILEYMQWGLVPSWAKDPKIGNKMINARAETVHEKPAFRSAYQKRRCLIPADGFYEWKKTDKGKHPYYIRLKSKQPFTFAGIWSAWQGAEGSELTTCSILTKEANAFMMPIHHRMPVIISREKRNAWMECSSGDPKRIQSLLTSSPDPVFEAYPVSTLVNSPKNNIKECLQPLSS